MAAFFSSRGNSEKKKESQGKLNLKSRVRAYWMFPLVVSRLESLCLPPSFLSWFWSCIKKPYSTLGAKSLYHFKIIIII